MSLQDWISFPNPPRIKKLGTMPNPYKQGFNPIVIVSPDVMRLARIGNAYMLGGHITYAEYQRLFAIEALCLRAERALKIL